MLVERGREFGTNTGRRRRTGVAGPDGGSPEKPVGTVWIAIATAPTSTPSSASIVARRFEFPGDRFTIRDRSVKTSLQMLRWILMDVDEPAPLLWEVIPAARSR